MTWFWAAFVLVILGTSIACWLSGRARPVSRQCGAALRRMDGDVGAATYRPGADQQRFNRP